MLARRFDLDDRELRFDPDSASLFVTIHPVVAEYDETAMLVFGWGILAGCDGLHRLVVNVVMPNDEPGK